MLLLVDGGYYTCYRYFATLRWWKFSHKGIEPDDHLDEFLDAFKKRYVASFFEFLKKNKLQPSKSILARDAPLRDVWRTELYEDYKGGRAQQRGRFAEDQL